MPNLAEKLMGQGTRSPNGNLMKFKPGIGMLSFELDVPVLPVFIKGAFEALPKGARFPRPKSIEIHFGNPIYPCKYQEFKDKIPNYDI
ncbi:MAG: 1-acyl-sn-glycerol-3-phosphate acyltransferase, partial [Cytophagales bacterium]|nr:1-acyl-sn-glycerol-3-phosphate acyltransferase [Cytophagales bacterium]